MNETIMSNVRLEVCQILVHDGVIASFEMTATKTLPISEQYLKTEFAIFYSKNISENIDSFTSADRVNRSLTDGLADIDDQTPSNDGWFSFWEKKKIFW